MEKAVPKVIPVRDPEKQPSKHAEIHPHLPQIEGFGGGALCLLVSPVRTGKSTLISFPRSIGMQCINTALLFA